MTAPLAYEFRPNPDETIRANRDVLRRRRFGWLHSGIWDWALWPVAVGMAVLYFFLPGDVRTLWLVGTVAFFLAAVVGLATPLIVRRQLRRQYSDTPSLRGPQVYQFSDGGLAMTGGATTTTLGWDSLVEAAETDAFFLFYHSKRQAFYLPKRVMGDEQQLQQLRQLLRTRLGPRAAGVRLG
jgi:membrane-bound metal-dependent hydrolase YbcI (DUF457 family)